MARWCVLLIALLVGCADGGLGVGDRDPTPTPTPEEPWPPGCPEIADCSDTECGPDPVCGVECGTCDGAPCLWGTCCVPETCESLGADCGAEVSDGCGGTLSCGGCSQGRVCGEDLTCDCQELTLDQELSIGVPTRTLTVTITLDGEPLSAANTAEDDLGVFSLKPEPPHAIGWEWVVRAPWDFGSGAPSATVEFPVVPGRYDLYYNARGGGPESPWPRNSGAQVAGGIEVFEDASIAVDVPSARVDLDLTARGEALAAYAAEVPAGSAATLSATGGDLGQVELAKLTDEPYLPGSVAVLPGTYRMQWVNTTGVAEALADPADRLLPLGRALDLAEAALADGGSLAWDLPVVDAQVELLLDGEVPPPPPAEIGAALQFDPTPEDPSAPTGGPGQNQAGPAVDQVLVPLDAVEWPLTLPLVPGRYHLRYVNTAAAVDAPPPPPSAWPWTQWPLALGETIEPGWARTFGVDTVEIEASATLYGAAMTVDNTAADDVGAIGLAARTKDDSLAISWLPQLWDGQPTNAVVRVVAGAYDVLYGSGSRQGMGHWPTALAPFPLEGNRMLTAPESVVWDVPVTAVPLTVTVGGGPLPESQAEDGDGPVLELSAVSAPNAADPELFGWTPQAHARVDLADPPTELLLVPGDYSLTYRPRGEPLGGAWGDAAETLLQGAEHDVLQQGIAVNLEFVPGRLTAALNGVDANPDNSDHDDHARFFITRGSPRATAGFLAFDTAVDGRMTVPVNLPRGNWFIQYYPSEAQHDPWTGADATPRWPLVPGVLWGCFDVQ